MTTNPTTNYPPTSTSTPYTTREANFRTTMQTTLKHVYKDVGIYMKKRNRRRKGKKAAKESTKTEDGDGDQAEAGNEKKDENRIVTVTGEEGDIEMVGTEVLGEGFIGMHECHRSAACGERDVNGSVDHDDDSRRDTFMGGAWERMRAQKLDRHDNAEAVSNEAVVIPATSEIAEESLSRYTSREQQNHGQTLSHRTAREETTRLGINNMAKRDAEKQERRIISPKSQRTGIERKPATAERGVMREINSDFDELSADLPNAFWKGSGPHNARHSGGNASVRGDHRDAELGEKEIIVISDDDEPESLREAKPINNALAGTFVYGTPQSSEREDHSTPASVSTLELAVYFDERSYYEDEEWDGTISIPELDTVGEGDLMDLDFLGGSSPQTLQQTYNAFYDRMKEVQVEITSFEEVKKRAAGELQLLPPNNAMTDVLHKQIRICVEIIAFAEEHVANVFIKQQALRDMIEEGGVMDTASVLEQVKSELDRTMRDFDDKLQPVLAAFRA